MAMTASVTGGKQHFTKRTFLLPADQGGDSENDNVRITLSHTDAGLDCRSPVYMDNPAAALDLMGGPRMQWFCTHCVTWVCPILHVQVGGDSRRIPPEVVPLFHASRLRTLVELYF